MILKNDSKLVSRSEKGALQIVEKKVKVEKISSGQMAVLPSAIVRTFL